MERLFVFGGKGFAPGSANYHDVWFLDLSKCAEVPCPCSNPKRGGEDNITLLQDQESSQKILVYPNPFKDFTTIEIPKSLLKINEPNTLAILDIFGVVKYSYKLSSNRITLWRNDLPSGIYFYYLENSEGIIDAGKMVIE